MSKKSFFWGVVTGIALTIAVLFVAGLISQCSSVQYLEEPISYENKTETSFKVFQVLGNAALATEASDRYRNDASYYGNTVLLLGEDFYCEQIVTIKNPQRVGSYSYTNKGGRSMTVPVIEGDIK